MAGAIVQESTQSANTIGGTTQSSTAFSAACAIGNTIELLVGYQNSTAPTSIVDSAGQTYTLAVTNYSAGPDYTTSLYIKLGNTSATALVVTVTWAGAHTNLFAWTREISGCGAVLASAQSHQLAPGTATDAITSGSMGPTGVSGFLSSFCVNLNTSTIPSAGTGFTAGTTGLSPFGGRSEWATNSGSAVAATYTDSGGATGGYTTLAVIYALRLYGSLGQFDQQLNILAWF